MVKQNFREIYAEFLCFKFYCLRIQTVHNTSIQNIFLEKQADY